MENKIFEELQVIIGALTTIAVVMKQNQDTNMFTNTKQIEPKTISELETLFKHSREKNLKNDCNRAFSSTLSKTQNNIEDRKGEKDNMQNGSIVLRKDGRYMGRFKNDGKVVCVYSRDYRECQRKLTIAINEMYEQRGLSVDSNMYFGKFMEYWFKNYKVETLKSTTVYNYTSKFNQVFSEKNNPLYKTPIKKLNELEVKRYFNTLERNLLIVALGFLKEALEIATAKGLMKVNIFPLIRIRVKTSERIAEKPKDIKRAFTLEEQETIFNSKFKNTEIVKIFTKFILYSGLRKGEAFAITWKDIDFKKMVLNVNKQYSLVTHSIVPPKTNAGIREVPIFKGAYDALMELKDFIGAENIDKEKAIFEDYKSLITNRVRYLLKKLGIGLSIHEMRHTFGSRLYLLGYDIKLIQKWLGHESTQVTLDTYVHVDSDFEKGNFEDALMVKCETLTQKS